MQPCQGRCNHRGRLLKEVLRQGAAARLAARRAAELGERQMCGTLCSVKSYSGTLGSMRVCTVRESSAGDHSRMLFDVLLEPGSGHPLKPGKRFWCRKILCARVLRSGAAGQAPFAACPG